MCPIRYRALVQVFGMKSSVSKSPDWCRTWKSHAVTRTTKSDYRTYGFGTIPVVRLALRAQPVDATPSDIDFLTKGGVYDPRETVWAFGGAEDRHVVPLEGGRLVA